ncbi:mycofactocin-associated electron transfer flavoprotein beta subunit [Amycolatopsis cynarae]|uniref:Mycofactocin-associated electron transfer flavoprotein beta subunit n=1 Tax=Amycolatopsis cynarae TaxID=2995223 RepID=A0ABY7B9U2_9PSEU|nr:mycofactocin-associated electron transfer flavoprotein beta subunit [Amycolatopsis sp. HUAS 11-8]WAL67478.1 mycofactocin-associated electron transfer flavoprotein beta subunit [Amycolatopsis sp. HUAS 11-8]
MLVVAALRWSDQRASVDPLTGEVRTDARTSGASAADRAALEHALRLAEAFGGRCLAVTVGPAEAEEMLREALAAGAHEVLRIEGPEPGRTVGEDGHDTARLLAAGLPARPDIVVCGDRSADRGTGSTPAFLAHELGACQALGLLELSVEDGRLRALRRLDGGRRERLAVSLPAVCSVEPAGTLLRRASLPAVLAARRAEVPSVPAVAPADAASGHGSAGVVRPYRPRPRVLPAPAGAEPHQRLLALTGALVERTPPKVLRPETPAEAARELLDYLRERGYLS